MPDEGALRAALRPDGAATSVALGPLALATTGPAPDPARRVACVVDGSPRTAALAADLDLDPGAPAETLVAAGYARLGETVAERLDGEFALVLWDRELGRGLLARDRLGWRPLFYAEHGGALLFASEVRNLLALLPSRPRPDRLALRHYLARAPLPADRTLFEGIRRLPGGESLRLVDGRWERWRHWRPRYAAPPAVAAAEAAREVRRALADAVERALDGAERPGILLSGGLDSTALAAVAGPRVTTYSGVFPEHPEVDESSRSRRVRDWLGVPGVEGALGGGSALAAAGEFIRAWELPPVSPNRFVWTPLMRRAAADGVDVMLDGEGGDELFGCAPYLLGDLIRAARPLAAVRTARRLPGMGEHPRTRWIARALLAYGARGALPHRLHERLRAARGRSGGPDWLADPVPSERWAWKRLHGPRWWAQLVHVLTADPLGAADELRRTAGLDGVAARHPLRDPRLIDVVLGLPPELAFDRTLDRPLLRRALAGDLPEDVLADVRKPAFNELLDEALTGPDRRAVDDMLRDPHPELAVLVKPTAVGSLLDRGSSAARPRAWALDVWRLAAAQMWLEYEAQRELPGGLLDGST